MKLQHFAVIFVIIVLPISFLLSMFMQSKIDEINLKAEYDSRISDATYDGIKAFELNTDVYKRQVLYGIQKIKHEETEEIIEVNDKTYTLDKMTDFIKKRLDEITKINLYDIGLSEEELKRRKNKKYELKKALKGCTYGDANDKKYVKELIYDILYREYGVDETNISKAIPFDVPSLLTSKDKFDIILYLSLIHI